MIKSPKDIKDEDKKREGRIVSGFKLAKILIVVDVKV